MEGSAHSTEQTVSESGVTVRQRYTDTEFDLPSVVFTLTSEHEETVTVRFVVPDIEAEKVGLHPQFRSDAWTITDEGLVFEATVDPGEEVTTLYALDRDDQSVFERAMDSLRIEAVVPSAEESGPSLDLRLDDPTGRDDRTDADLDTADPPEETTASDGGGATPETGGATRDAETGEETGDTETGEATGDTETGEATGGRGEKRETAVHGAGGDTATDVSADESGTERGPADDSSAPPESQSSAGEQSAADGTALAAESTAALVDELLDRLETDELPPTHRERLAEQVIGERGADAVRLASLQSRVSDIEAFSGPVEQFLDRHGQPAEVFDAFETRLEAVETLDERVRELETRVETVDDHDERIESLEKQAETLDERVAELGDDIDTTAEQLSEELASIEAEIGTVREQLETVETTVEAAREETRDAQERADGIETDLSDIEEQLGGLEARLEDLAGEWETAEAELTALQEWRSDLARTFEVFEE